MRQSSGVWGSNSNLKQQSNQTFQSSMVLVSPSSNSQHMRSKSQSTGSTTDIKLLQHILIGSPPPTKPTYNKQSPYSFSASSANGEKRVIALLAFFALAVIAFFHLGFSSSSNGSHSALHASGWAFIHQPERRSKTGPIIR